MLKNFTKFSIEGGMLTIIVDQLKANIWLIIIYQRYSHVDIPYSAPNHDMSKQTPNWRTLLEKFKSHCLNISYSDLYNVTVQRSFVLGWRHRRRFLHTIQIFCKKWSDEKYAGRDWKESIASVQVENLGDILQAEVWRKRLFTWKDLE